MASALLGLAVIASTEIYSGGYYDRNILWGNRNYFQLKSKEKALVVQQIVEYMVERHHNSTLPERARLADLQAEFKREQIPMPNKAVVIYRQQYDEQEAIFLLLAA